MIQFRLFIKAGASAEAVRRISGRAGVEIKPVEKDENEAVANIKTATKLEDAIKKAAALRPDIYKGIIFTRYGMSARVARQVSQLQGKPLTRKTNNSTAAKK